MHTCSYVGFSTCPPLYPETTDFIPGYEVKGLTMHQKQPPASVAYAMLYSLLKLSVCLNLRYIVGNLKYLTQNLICDFVTT